MVCDRGMRGATQVVGKRRRKEKNMSVIMTTPSQRLSSTVYFAHSELSVCMSWELLTSL